MEKQLIDISTIWLAIFSLILIGYLIGYFQHYVVEQLTKLWAKPVPEPKREVGGTAGSYRVPPIPDVKKPPIEKLAKTGVSQMKTPAMLEWEEQERIRMMQNQHTGPINNA